MNKTKLIALCGICGAVTVVCLVCLSYVKWVALVLAVVASVATCCPQILDGKYVWYSVAIYFVSVVVSCFLGNLIYLAPVAIFAMPCCIWKLFCQYKGQSNQKQWNTLRWIGNFVLVNVALAVTALLAYVFSPSILQGFVEKPYLAYILVVAFNLAVIAYDKLLAGAIYIVKNALKKSKFGQ